MIDSAPNTVTGTNGLEYAQHQLEEWSHAIYLNGPDAEHAKQEWANAAVRHEAGSHATALDLAERVAQSAGVSSEIVKIGDESVFLTQAGKPTKPLVLHELGLPELPVEVTPLAVFISETDRKSVV